jgi:hypothetical protein
MQLSVCRDNCVHDFTFQNCAEHTQLATSVIFVRKATQEMPHRALGQTVICLDLFHSADVTAEAVFDRIVQMVTSVFARFVSLIFKFSKNVKSADYKKCNSAHCRLLLIS